MEPPPIAQPMPPVTCESNHPAASAAFAAWRPGKPETMYSQFVSKGLKKMMYIISHYTCKYACTINYNHVCMPSTQYNETSKLVAFSSVSSSCSDRWCRPVLGGIWQYHTTSQAREALGNLWVHWSLLVTRPSTCMMILYQVKWNKVIK